MPSGGTGITWNPGYDGNNHYTLAGTSYDSDGNLLTDTFHTYTWDSNDKVKTVDNITLTYDAFGRVVEDNSSGYTEFIYTPLGKMLVNGSTLKAARIPLPGGAFAQYNASGLAGFMSSDWSGTVRAISAPNNAGYVSSMAVAPFGEPYAVTGGMAEMFIGQPQDLVTGLTDTDAREYHETSGRFIQPDPTGSFNLGDPQTFNQYAYSRNSPMMFSDPSGANWSINQELLDDKDKPALPDTPLPQLPLPPKKGDQFNVKAAGNLIWSASAPGIEKPRIERLPLADNRMMIDFGTSAHPIGVECVSARALMTNKEAVHALGFIAMNSAMALLPTEGFLKFIDNMIEESSTLEQLDNLTLGTEVETTAVAPVAKKGGAGRTGLTGSDSKWMTNTKNSQAPNWVGGSNPLYHAVDNASWNSSRLLMNPSTGEFDSYGPGLDIPHAEDYINLGKEWLDNKPMINLDELIEMVDRHLKK